MTQLGESDADSISNRALALIGLVSAQLEVEGEQPSAATAWPLIGPALLAHATSSLESIVFRLRPDGAHNDASRLLRSLYDHIVTFAWLAADPPSHLEVWRKADLEERLKAVREFDEAGVKLISDSVKAEMQRSIEAITGSVPDLASMAVSADRYWSPRISGLPEDGLSSFRGIYTVLFRQHSGLVHATFRGLNHVTVDPTATRKKVVREAPLEGTGPYGMATAVYGLGLLVSAQALGWPAAKEISAVFERTR